MRLDKGGRLRPMPSRWQRVRNVPGSSASDKKGGHSKARSWRIAAVCDADRITPSVPKAYAAHAFLPISSVL